jgi:hypothetical protein
VSDLPEDQAVSAAWQVWIAESLLGGFSAEATAARLVEAGVDEVLATSAVRAIQSSPAAIAARRLLAARAPEVLACQLAREVEAIGGGRVPTRARLDEAELRDVHLAHGVPLFVPRWGLESAAVSNWSPEWLAERFGDAIVRVCDGRAEPRRGEQHHGMYTVEQRLDAFAARVREVGSSNELYMVAQHRNLAGPLAGLIKDLPLPPLVEPHRVASCSSLWFGPAGTRTPAHHDTTNVLFFQVHGEKRIWLASTAQVALARGARGFYAPLPLSEPAHRSAGGALAGVTVYEVSLKAGDLLLIPAGWWHEVHALSVSISVSFTGLAVPNRYDFYMPGLDPRR